jgi:hypothetical protein
MSGVQVSLTVAKIANVGLGLASCFFPGIPTIPDDLLAKGSDILAGLDHKSSAEDFACIQVGVQLSLHMTAQPSQVDGSKQAVAYGLLVLACA